MKRILAVLPLACLLAGCGANTEESTPVADGSDTSTTIINNTDGAIADGAVADDAVADPDGKPVASAPAKKPVVVKATGTKSTSKPAAKTPVKVVAAGSPDPSYKVVDESVPGLAKITPPPKSMVVPVKARVRLVTSKGPITLELNGKEAPLHVKSFLHLSKRGFYNGVQFHRYANLMEGSPDGKTGWIIQGGDPLSKNAETRQYSGGGGPGYQVPREHNNLKHDRYVIAAARTADPDSAGSQFYLTTDPVPFLDEGDGYTVFGKIIEGQANAQKLRQGDVIKSVALLK